MKKIRFILSLLFSCVLINVYAEDAPIFATQKQINDTRYLFQKINQLSFDIITQGQEYWVPAGGDNARKHYRTNVKTYIENFSKEYGNSYEPLLQESSSLDIEEIPLTDLTEFLKLMHGKLVVLVQGIRPKELLNVNCDSEGERNLRELRYLCNTKYRSLEELVEKTEKLLNFLSDFLFEIQFGNPIDDSWWQWAVETFGGKWIAGRIPFAVALGFLGFLTWQQRSLIYYSVKSCFYDDDEIKRLLSDSYNTVLFRSSGFNAIGAAGFGVVTLFLKPLREENEQEAKEKVKLQEVRKGLRAVYLKRIPSSHSPLDESVGIYGLLDQQKDLGPVISYLKQPGKFIHRGIRIPRGVLFYGPSGTGKTLLAKWVKKNVENCKFISIPARLLLSQKGRKRVGESFESIKKMAPAVIFIDELDRAVGGKRLKDGALGHEYSAAQEFLATLLDGIGEKNPWAPVIVMSATNAIEKLEDDVLRRFDVKIKIDLPNKKTRLEILQDRLKREIKNTEEGFAGLKFDSSVDLSSIAQETKGMSGDGIDCLVNQVRMKAVSEGREVVTRDDFDKALKLIKIQNQTEVD